MSSPRPPFRPDIEGLRGIAILLVVLYHAGVSAMAGGFVGVDVFFVLSGFFITAPLARDVAAHGSVDLTGFYGRRLQRLVPALLVVLLATLGLVMWLYAPIDRAAVAANMRAVAFYSGNLAFASASENYFSSGDNPLLHTWSLGVEQQFYLVWPLLLLSFATIARRLHRRRLAARGESADADPTRTGYAAARGVLLGILVAGVLSFLLSLWLTRAAPTWAFFGPHTRLWEFALGGMLALVTSQRDASEDLAPAPSWLPGIQAAGLFAIGAAVLAYDRTVPYPGLAALVPALGAVMLLVGGAAASATPIGRALAARPLQWLGRMSYAWYLWHWPLIGLGHVLAPEIGPWGRLAWSVVALGLAWLTHRLIEQPAREGRRFTFPREWQLTGWIAASLGVVLLAQASMQVAQRQASRGEQRAYAAAREDRMRHDCWANTVDALPSGPCAFGDTRSSTTIVLLGDSHAEHWLGGLDRVGRERGWRIVAYVKGGCPVSDLSAVSSSRVARRFRECNRYREAMLDRIVAMKPAAVILSSYDHYVPADGDAADWQVTPDVWRTGLRRTYARVTGAGIPTVAIRGTPRTWFDVPACLSRRAAGLPFAGDCTYDRRRAHIGVARAAQTEAARGLPIAFVDMNDQICDSARCPVVRNGIVMFTDDNHLTASFTRSLAPVLGERVAAAMRSAGARVR